MISNKTPTKSTSSQSSAIELDFSKEVIEKYLFKRLLTDKAMLNILASDFDSRWIQTEYLGKTMSLCLAFYKKYNKIPNLKIAKALIKKYLDSIKHEESYVNVCTTIDNAMTMDFGTEYDEILSKNIINFIRKQALWTSMMDNAEDIEKNHEGVLDKCLARFDKITKITLGQKNLGMDYFNSLDMTNHWKFIRNPDDKISTGWESLDGYMNGGFWKSGRMLGAFVGQAGLGKSMFLSNLAVNCMKNGLKVVVISMEMSENIYAMRFDAHISGANINRLKTLENEAVSRIIKFHEDHPTSELHIMEYPPRSIRVRDIELYLDNLLLAGKTFDIVIVDYLNLVLPNHSSDSMYKDVQAVSEDLRTLSYKYEKPFWTATQANTEGINNENIDMQNVSESRGITHTLDFLGALFQIPDDRESGIIKCRILKNRLGGQVGKVCSFKINSENLTIEDISYCPSPNVLDEVSASEEYVEAENISKNIKEISNSENEL